MDLLTLLQVLDSTMRLATPLLLACLAWPAGWAPSYSSIEENFLQLLTVQFKRYRISGGK